jgi:hypothetical protein
MPDFERKHLKPGTKVLVHSGGRAREGELVSLPARVGGDARVRFSGESEPVHVPLFGVSPLPRRTSLRQRLRGLIAPAVVLGVLGLIPAYLALFQEDGPTSPVRTAPLSTPTSLSTTATVPSLELKGSLLVYDTAYGKKWGKAISADITDPLRFSLSLHNNSNDPTPSLNVEPLWIQPSDEPNPVVVEIAAGPLDRESVVPGAAVEITPQSLGSLGVLYFEPTTYKVETPGGAARSVQTASSYSSNFRSSTGTVTGSEPAVIGSMPAHSTVTITFSGHSQLNSISDPTPFEFGGTTVAFGNAFGAKSLPTGDASPGEVLFFRVMLYPPAGVPVSPFVRVAITPHPTHQFVTVSASASVYGDKPQQLGSAVVNSATGEPIALSIIRGSTQLYGYPGVTCAHIKDLAPLPDGIAEGGIQMGSVGGFLPRDPCHAREWPRWVQFKARVRRA